MQSMNKKELTGKGAFGKKNGFKSHGVNNKLMEVRDNLAKAKMTSSFSRISNVEIGE